jgi:ABC-2 type transport system permease protein
VSEEINSGDFSKYLSYPINFYWFNFWREFAQRAIHMVSAVLEVIIFAIILNVELLIQINWLLILFFLISTALAVFLYYNLSFLVSLLAFWSREAHGPRFMFEWLLEFASGAYFPLDILPQIIFGILFRLPFFYIIYFPISIYLGKFTIGENIFYIGLQIIWIALLVLLTNIVWQQGLKRYSGEGI